MESSPDSPAGNKSYSISFVDSSNLGLGLKPCPSSCEFSTIYISNENFKNQREIAQSVKNHDYGDFEEENLKVRKESRTEESSKEERDTYEENVRETELIRSRAPISFHRFDFHVGFWRVCGGMNGNCSLNTSLLINLRLRISCVWCYLALHHRVRLPPSQLMKAF